MSKMFVTNGERSGSTAYFEFSYCKNPKKFGNDSSFKYWSVDSLCVHIDDEKVFFENYGKYLKNPRFDYFGLNYYTKEQTKEIIKQITRDKPQEYAILLSWLQCAADDYYGFCFVGI